MMDIYNRMFTAELAKTFLKGKNYIFLYSNFCDVTGNPPELRGARLKDELRPKHCIKIDYIRKGINKEGRIEDAFRAFGMKSSKEEYSSLRKKDMMEFLNNVFKISHILVVDFTLMNTRFLGALVSILNLFSWEEVFFCYTEPGSYNKNDFNEFDLKNVTMGYDQIPNLETIAESSTECDWVVFLGFEGSRLMRLEEESPASKRNSVLCVSVPAMKTEWHNFSIDANRSYFELKFDNSIDMHYVSAINPFEAYHKLNQLYEENRGVRMVISPIGSKPVMLGCIMHVLEHEDEMLFYDNPNQEGSNTSECGDSHFYDLTYFVRTIKNNRIL